MQERDLSGLRALAEELTGQVAKLRTGMVDMRNEINALTATVKSPDGYVTATVGPRGQLVRLQLDPRIYRTPDSTALATTITQTVQKAAAEAAKKVEAVAAKYAPGVAVGDRVHDDVTERLRRLDFLHDQIVGTGE